MIGSNTPRRAAFLQVLLGLIVGPVAVWALVNGLPIQSGRTVIAVTLAVALVVAVVMWVRFRTVRPAAVGFGLGALATSLLLAVVVS